MICPRCGAQIEEGAKFCSDCGAAMDVQEEKTAKKTLRDSLITLMT